VTDGDLARAAERQLAALELEVSTLRRALFDRIDALQAELTRRYRDGETHRRRPARRLGVADCHPLGSAGASRVSARRRFVVAGVTP
jgi:hypothetical protein